MQGSFGHVCVAVCSVCSGFFSSPFQDQPISLLEVCTKVDNRMLNFDTTLKKRYLILFQYHSKKGGKKTVVVAQNRIFSSSFFFFTTCTQCWYIKSNWTHTNTIVMLIQSNTRWDSYCEVDFYFERFLLLPHSSHPLLFLPSLQVQKSHTM